MNWLQKTADLLEDYGRLILAYDSLKNNPPDEIDTSSDVNSFVFLYRDLGGRQLNERRLNQMMQWIEDGSPQKYRPSARLRRKQRMHNWHAASKIAQEEERPVAAAVRIQNEQTGQYDYFTGKFHFQAIQNAIDAGALKRDEEGRLDFHPGYDSIDLFVTNRGNYIDRFTADRLYGITASEDIALRDEVRM